MPKVSIGLHELPDTPHFLYRLYDRTDALLYIGITNDPKTRFKWHRKNQPWWADADQARTRIDYHPARGEALEAERKAIVAESPLYNDQHNLTVDTPSSRIAEEAQAKFADSIIRRLAGGEEHYKAAIQDAVEVISSARENDEWKPFTTNPRIYAAASMAGQTSSELWHYKAALNLLLEALPIPQVEACRVKAEADLQDDDLPPEEHDIAFGTVAFLVEELGDEYLDSLNQEEARGWRACAAAMLHPNAKRSFRVQHAAAYAKAVKAGRAYDQAWELCTASGKGGAKCPKRVAELAFIAECAPCGDRPCEGHSFWCPDHMENARAGAYRWTKSDKDIVIARTAPWGAAIEEPEF